MRKILVPVDGSDNALRAVHYAAGVAKENPAVQLELLHVLDPIALRSYATLSHEEVKKFQVEEAAAKLRSAQQALDEAGVRYEVRSRIGSTPNEISHQVQESGCEAIIMGTRGMGPMANLVIGSVATQVVHLVSVPVTLIK